MKNRHMLLTLFLLIASFLHTATLGFAVDSDIGDNTFCKLDYPLCVFPFLLFSRK